VDEDGLRALDDALRQDVPGADGWVNDPYEFCEYTFDDRHFDPATYLVAVDDVNQAYAGLARVWNNPGRPPSGPDRRHARLPSNTASNALLLGIGARRTGGSIELVRRAPH
jgi:hypothetical protein